MESGPPICDFDAYKPITMSVIGSYDVGDLNLSAIFMLLPVTDRVLGPNASLQKKQGKICFPPEFNRPGEILSMRFKGQVRGIIRSENPTSFPHSIIIDIGTSDRIISMKLSRSLKLNGPRSMEIAREAAQAILNHIKETQKELDLIAEHRDVAIEVRNRLCICASTNVLLDEESLDEVGKRIAQIFKRQIRGYPLDKIGPFLDVIISFNQKLYTGTLQLGRLESEMVNIQYHLGLGINKMAFWSAINQKPFIANYNTVKPAAPVNVFYQYTKYDMSGEPVEAKHSIRVNQSGHVRHSGPNLEAMKPVYYAFIQRVLQHWSTIQAVENKKQKIKITATPRVYSVNEWRDLLRREEELRRKILAGEVTIATGEPSPPREEPIIRLGMIEDAIMNNGVISGPIVQANHQEDVPVISFNYSSLVQM